MEESIEQKEKEKQEEQMINQAFRELLDDYLATKHIRVSNGVRASHTSCTPSLWRRLCAMK